MQKMQNFMENGRVNLEPISIAKIALLNNFWSIHLLYIILDHKDKYSEIFIYAGSKFIPRSESKDNIIIRINNLDRLSAIN